MGNANRNAYLLNPDRMASLGITTSDINNAVANQNKRFAAGNIGAAPSASRNNSNLPGSCSVSIGGSEGI